MGETCIGGKKIGEGVYAAKKAKEVVVGIRQRDGAFSLLKRGIVGTWHRICAKHLSAYLDEMT
jgi:hypothetical protein